MAVLLDRAEPTSVTGSQRGKKGVDPPGIMHWESGSQLLAERRHHPQLLLRTHLGSIRMVILLDRADHNDPHYDLSNLTECRC